MSNTSEPKEEYGMYFEGLLQLEADNDKDGIEALRGAVSTDHIYHYKIFKYLGNGKTQILEEI